MIVVIPARGGSKGIVGKNLMNLCGRPLVEWSILQAKKAFPNNFICVATDDEAIGEVALENGVNVYWRSAASAGDGAAMGEVLREIIDYDGSSWSGLIPGRFDTIVLMQPTNPLRRWWDLRKAYTWYREDDLRFLACAHNNVIIRGDSFSNKRRQDLEKTSIQHGMLYIYDTKSKPLGKELLTEEKIGVFATPRWQSFELDEPEDVALVEFYMHKEGICTMYRGE